MGAVGAYLALEGPVWRPGRLGLGGREPALGAAALAPARAGSGGAAVRGGLRGHGAGGGGAARSSRRSGAVSPESPATAGDAAGQAAGRVPDGAARQPVTGAMGAMGAAGVPAAPDTPAAAAGGQARVALVIDDLGRSLEELASLHRLGVPLTYAVLPFESQTPEVAAALRRSHDEILCHLPMEPKSGGNPGPGALRAGMSPEQLRQSTLAAIAAVPGAVGVNNHMGSALSADAIAMSTILGVMAGRGLYFLDSRTSSQSVAFRVATALGVPAAERQVFLDDDPRPAAVAAEFQRLLDLARTRGGAIAIGHPHAATLATLAAEVPRAQALGYRFVQVSALLDRPAAAPQPADR